MTGDPIEALPDFRRKSADLLVALPAEVFDDLKASCDWLAAYKNSKKPRPGTPESVIVERTRNAIIARLVARKIDQAQAADMVDMLVAGSS